MLLLALALGASIASQFLNALKAVVGWKKERKNKKQKNKKREIFAATAEKAGLKRLLK